MGALASTSKMAPKSYEVVDIDRLTVDKSTLDEVVVTDTIPLTKEAQESNKIRQLSVADELAESIRRISNEESLSALFTKRVQPTLF